jgi:hypothetical protein
MFSLMRPRSRGLQSELLAHPAIRYEVGLCQPPFRSASRHPPQEPGAQPISKGSGQGNLQTLRSNTSLTARSSVFSRCFPASEDTSTRLPMRVYVTETTRTSGRPAPTPREHLDLLKLSLRARGARLKRSTGERCKDTPSVKPLAVVRVTTLFERSYQLPAYDDGTKKNQFMLAGDVIFFF